MKKSLHSHSRRRFLKLSTAGTAGFITGPLTAKSGGSAEDKNESASGWIDGMQINPAIDNLRVVFCHDPSMASGFPSDWQSMQSQNEPVVREKVHENMDKMAMALARKGDPAAAWSTVFQQPAGKSWQDVQVAVKINTIELVHLPRLDVISKVCLALNDLGVPFENMTIYDASRGISLSEDSILLYKEDYAKSKLPSGVHISDTLGGERVPVTLPDGSEEPCCPWLADGSVDILVNMAMNKGHVITYSGKFTLTLKNHIGSLVFLHPGASNRRELPLIPGKLVAMSKSTAILGEGTPPRQQLCIVDSLWASKTGPHARPDTQTHCLVMGTFSPAVDYQTVKKIREELPEDKGGKPYGMGMTDTNHEVLEQFLTDFGYHPDDFLDDEHWIDAMTYNPPVAADSAKGPESGMLIVSLTGPLYAPAQAAISLPSRGMNLNVDIVNTGGTMIRSFSIARTSATHSLNWDGRDKNGKPVHTGAYIVRLKSGKHTRFAKLMIRK